MRSPHPLPPYPQNLTERLAHWAKAAPDRVFLAQRDAAGSWRTLTYARNARRGARDRRGAARSATCRPIARSRSSPATTSSMRCSALPPCMSAFPTRRSRCPIRCCRAISASSKPSSKSSRRGWSSPPTARLSRAPSPPPCRRTSKSWSLQHPPRGPAQRRFRRTRERAADAGGRSGACQSRSGDDRENSLHLRLDRPAERRHQHPAHAVREPGDDPRRLALCRRRAAGPGRLAAVEPYLRRQPQFRPGARQWRLALYRRRQAAARRHRGDGAQSARRRADHLFQRAEGL